MRLGVGEDAPTLAPAKGSVSPGRDRTHERISDIIRVRNDLFGDDLREADRIRQASNLAAVS